MKTLVIHPDDRSTDFLKKIYKDKDWTVITDLHILNTKRELEGYIKMHDRIIMMGHGYPGGLFYTKINSDMVYLLREKECVCIWCNADKFVEKYGLRGFYTGMFISEVGEANYFRITENQENVTYSNDLFANLVNKYIDEINILYEVKSSYIGETQVIQFNNDRLYYRKDNTV